jgi:hypothetical protein
LKPKHAKNSKALPSRVFFCHGICFVIKTESIPYEEVAIFVFTSLCSF